MTHHNGSPVILSSSDEGFGDFNVAEYIGNSNNFHSPLRLGSQSSSPTHIFGKKSVFSDYLYIFL